MRKKVIIGNWKMFKNNSEAIKFIKEVDGKVTKNTNRIAGIAVPYTALAEVRKVAKNIIISAQNCHFEEDGAFTGEISIPMLKDINIEYVVIGHSERRQMFLETNETVNLKAKALIKNNMTPVLCCGESLETYEKGDTNKFVSEQIEKALVGINKDDVKKIILAYEPIWAIGTGKVATPEIAQKVCQTIRNKVKDLYDQNTADEILIQYGGSVKPDNIKEILGQPDIDGALVGGASLDATSYLGLVN